MSALSNLVKEGIEILKNPRARDVISLAKDAPDNQLRVMKSHPDTYYWSAYDGDHDGVRQLLDLPREYTGLTDILTYDKGKFHPEYNKSYIEDAADYHGTNYEDERKEWMMRNFGLPSIAAMLGSGLTDEFADGIMEEPQEFAGGGVVKAGKKLFNEALQQLDSYKGQGHHAINTDKGKPIQELMMRELGEEATHPMELLRFNHGAFDDLGDSIRPEELKVGDILSAKNLTSTYGQYDDEMLEQLVSVLKLNEVEPHAFQIRTEPSARYIDVESQLKKLYGNEFSDHESEVILAPQLRYMLEHTPELRRTEDGSEYYNYLLKHLPESEKDEFPELFSKPIRGYIASGAGLTIAPQLSEQDPQEFAHGGLVYNYPYQ